MSTSKKRSTINMNPLSVDAAPVNVGPAKRKPAIKRVKKIRPVDETTIIDSASTLSAGSQDNSEPSAPAVNAQAESISDEPLFQDSGDKLSSDGTDETDLKDTPKFSPRQHVDPEQTIAKPCFARYPYQNSIESSRILRNMVTGEWGFYLNSGVFVSLMSLEGPIDTSHSKNNFVPLMLAGGVLGGVLGFAAAVFFTRKQSHIFRVKHGPDSELFVSLDRRSLSFLKEKVSTKVMDRAST